MIKCQMAVRCALVATGVFLSAPVALSVEFRVNSHTQGAQWGSSVATDNWGNFVISWTDNDLDGSGQGVYAQRYDSAGAPQGNEFLVNTHTYHHQKSPQVGMDSDGDFVVAWTSWGDQDGDRMGIFAQRYNSQGIAQGQEFQVNTYTSSAQEHVSVDMAPDGNFVIAWSSNTRDGDYYGVAARRYNSAGVAQGDEFQVNTYTTGAQLFPSVTMDANGAFVVAWQSEAQDGNDSGIFAQLFDQFGAPQGDEFQVNTQVLGGQRYPSVAMSPGSDFIVTWENGDNMFAQRFDSSGGKWTPFFGQRTGLNKV